MSDNNWAEYTETFENRSRQYINASHSFDRIEHYGLVSFGDPNEQSFLRKISKTLHIFKTGDKLSKIAYEYYGDPKLWWVLAWFNSKPTDFHCRIGDTIEVPKPLDEVLMQIHNREDV